MYPMNNPTAAYAKVGIETGVAAADPHQLIVMLFDGALLAVNKAVIALEADDLAAKGKAISHAIAIIGEGLKASLDMNAGGELAQRLAALYDYMIDRLVYANAQKNPAALTEVGGLLRELKDAWEGIAEAARQMP